MLVKKQAVTVIKIDKREGTSKKGEPFKFYACHFIDETGNAIRMNFSNALTASYKESSYDGKPSSATVDFQIYQSGFNLRGTLVAISF